MTTDYLTWSWQAGLLDPGETLLWSGQPDPLRYARGKSLAWFIMGVIFICGTLPTIVRATENDLRGALAFFAIGTLLALSPLWHFVRGRWATYVVTDRRAIIDIAGVLPRRTAVPLSEITDIKVHAPNATINEIGDIIFKELPQTGEGYTPPIGFYAVPDVKNVEQIFRKAVESRQRSASS